MNEKICGIYCIENLVNGKRYIGKDGKINKETRWKYHKTNLSRNSHINEYLQLSWNKYGENNFLYHVLEFCKIGEMNDREMFFIKLYKTTNEKYGYNLTSGGEGTPGFSHKEETKRKMSLAMMGNKNGVGHTMSEESKKRHSIRMMGNVVKDSTKRKLSEQQMGLFGEKSRKFGIKEKNSKSSFFGVYPRENRKGYTVWRVMFIEKDRKMKRFTVKTSEIDAAKTYDKYIIENNLPNPLNFPRRRKK